MLLPNVSLSRRDLLRGASAAALQATAFGAKTPASRTNVVVIMADDLAAWMLGCYGNTEIKTPNIDTLARLGMRFNNSFVVTPMCSASRATFFTGRLPRQHGIHDFFTPEPVQEPPQGQKEPPASFAKETMLSDILAGAGYQCGYVGKWYMGNEAAPGHGYTYTYTMPSGEPAYQDPEMVLNGKPVREQGYLTDLVTKRATAFIEQQNPQKPFLLTVGYLNPHIPYTGHPQKYYDLYANTKFDSVGYRPAAPNALRQKEMLQDTLGNIRRAAAAITALDDQIPILLNSLRQRNLLDNTIVIFTSDSGYLLGRHGLWSKGHASNPINMFEEVMRVPFLISWTGKIPAEAVVPEMISFTDVLPTLCEALNVAAPTASLPGRSFLPITTRKKFPKKQPWRNMVFGHFRNTEMARDTRYKLVLRNEGSGPNELFDVVADPVEMKNQYDNPEYVTVRDRLTRELAEWRKRTA